MEDAIEQLRQEVEVLRQSLEELTVVFEHAVHNGRIVIEVTQGPLNDEEATPSRGNRKQNLERSRQASEQVLSATNREPSPSPAPGNMF